MLFGELLVYFDKENIKLELYRSGVRIFATKEKLDKAKELVENNKELIIKYLKRKREALELADKIDNEPLLTDEERYNMLERFELLVDDMGWLERKKINGEVEKSRNLFDI